MKNLIQKKRMLSFIASFFIFLNSASAANFIVSGADRTELNGTYVETGTWKDKPLYILNNEQSNNEPFNFAIVYENEHWIIGRLEIGAPNPLRGYYVNDAPNDAPPSANWFRSISLVKMNEEIFRINEAEPQEVDGEYVRDVDKFNNRPTYYRMDDVNYVIRFEEGMWMMGRLFQEEGVDFPLKPFYRMRSMENFPPENGWEGMPAFDLKVEMEAKTLSYSTSLFTEHLNNNGSISNSIVITYNEAEGDAFTGEINDNFISSNKITVSNVPAGLMASIVKTAGNELTFSLTGNASSHERTDRIYNIVLTFQDAAFVQANATNVSNFNISDIGIQYIIFSSGYGTSENPHQIATLADLRILSENTNYGGSGTYFIQTANIDATETNTWNVGNHDGNAGTADVAMGFSPIGNFSGSYDGQGHTISNLFINRPATNYVGLFGSSSSTYKNIGLTNVFIVGYDRVGGLIGQSSGSVTNCFTTGSVKGNWLVGGLVGLNYANISKSYSNVNAEGNNDIGGLIGQTWGGNISNSYATGSVRGNTYIASFIGLLGGSATVDRCYAVGVVAGNVGSTFKGGFIAYKFAGTITNCYWDMETSEQTTSAAATGKTTAEMKALGTFTNWEFVTTPVWKINSLKNNGYPYLAWQNLPIDAPNTQASALVFSLVHNNDMTISWTNGSGTSRAVFVKEGTGAISLPANQTTYTASSDWATPGTQLATSGYYCVYNGTGNSLTITNLAKNTQYSVQVIEYNGGADAEVYCTTTGANNPLSQTTANEGGTGFDMDNANKLMVYPNPVVDAFRIQGLSGVSYITISDLSGRTLIQKQISDNEAVSVSTLPKGVYILKIKNNEGVTERKVVKK